MFHWYPKNVRSCRLVFWPVFLGLAALALWVLNNPLIYTRPRTALNYYGLAKWYDQQQRFDQEEYCILKSLSLDPHSYKALMMAGVLYHRQGQHIRARGWFEKALAIVDQEDRFNHAALLYDLGSSYAAEHDAGRAWEYFTRARELNVPGAGIWGEQAAEPTYWVVRGDRARFDASLTTYYSGGFGWYLRQARHKRPAATLKLCDAYMHHNPGSIYEDFLYPLRVEALISLGRSREALEFIRKVEGSLAHAQVRLQLKRELLRIFSDRKEPARALAALDEIMALSSESGVSGKAWARFRVERAALLAKAGRDREAVREYQNILDSFASGHVPFSGDVVRAGNDLVRLLFIQRNHAEAYARMLLITTDIRYVLQTCLGSLTVAGCVWGVLSLAVFFFFRQRHVEARSGAVKLWHVFVLTAGAGVLGGWCVPLVVGFDHVTGGALAAAGVDLYLFGLALYSGSLAYAAWAAGSRVYRWTGAEMGLIFEGWAWLARRVLAGSVATALLFIGIHGLGLWFSGGVSSVPSLVEEYISRLPVNSGLSSAWIIAIVVFFLPVCEEVVFRMFLFRFLQTFMGAAWAVAMVALVFMAGHFSGGTYENIVYGGFSLVLSWLYLRSGSLYPAIIVHILVNFVGFLMITGTGRC